MTTREQGIAAIKAHEGLRLQAYPDPGSGGEPWTIGWGHTGGVKRGDVITIEQAEKFLAEDIAEAQDGIRELVKVPLTDGQLWALTSFVFNLGAGALRKSTLLKRLNAGDYAGAAEQFGLWVNAAGKPMPGLVRRRAEEKAMFLSGGFLNTSPKPVQIPPENAHVKEAPVAPLIAMLGKTLISAFAPLAAEKIQREISRHTDRPEVAEQITDAVITAAKVATGLEDPIEAVAEARKDPQVLAQVEASVLDKLTSMAPMLQQLDAMDRQRFADEEGSRAAAHARNPSDWDMTPVLVYGALALVGSLVLLVSGISVYQVVASDKGLTTEVWAAVTGLIGFAAGIGSTVYAFRFGTTRGSGAKDLLIKQLSTGVRDPL